MKKVIFLSAIALAAAVSCSKSEVVDTKFGNEAIGFDTYLGRGAQTKATETTAANLAEFGVYGFYTAAVDYASGTTANLMNHVKVTKSGNDWTYSPARYWTNETDKYTFFAYAPYSVGKAGGAPEISYIVPSALADQKDVIYSVNNRNVTKTSCKQTDGTYVPFEFKHALSRIAVKANAKMYDKATGLEITGTPSAGQEYDHTFTIKNISLSGKFCTTGTMDLSEPFTTAQDGTVSGGPVWTSTPSAVTYNLTGAVSQPLTKDPYKFSEIANNYLMVIPTTFSADKDAEGNYTNAAALTIQYTVTYAGATSDVITKTVYVTTGFEQGKAYVIELTLQRNDDNAIIFNVKGVDRWEDDQTVTVS